MSSRRGEAPSALRTGLLHAGMSFALFSGLGAIAAGAVNAMGNPVDAGPVQVVALFESQAGEPSPGLKRRLADMDGPALQVAAMTRPAAQGGEPSLDVPEYSEPAREAAGAERQAPSESGSAAENRPKGVRINGREVLPGEAYSEVEALQSLAKAPLEGLYEHASAGRLPRISDDGRKPADAYARPFYNRAGKPTVSIVLGGLGINYTHTINAIEELPAGVTLSFAPHARGLQTWVRRARADGHEVLIELPMEPHEHGRVRPHANTLETASNARTNTARLERVLALASGYYGVINYQGDKFATNGEALAPMLEALSSRGLAFVEDGSLSGSVIEEGAGRAGTLYAGADLVIDARIDADAMKDQLLALESMARKDGAAFGTAIAYPLTIDILKEWTDELAEKGILLAPASSIDMVPDAPQPPVDLADTPKGTGSLP
ncbi:MAG: divergent polysaccharide deacetylase family protein [Alphaproteobacteria bacterium]|nr:divergent polysaccharide deacetylase family protein [Alphaproteobacteria bacterium]